MQKYGQKILFVCYFSAKDDENTEKFIFGKIKYGRNENLLDK